MDLNSEKPSPTAEIAEVDIELSEIDPVYQPPISPLLSSNIFNDAFGPPRNTSQPGPAQTPEESRRFYEEEFQKRLRGEYEVAQQRLGTVVSENLNRPLRLTSIHLSPSPPITRSSFLTSLLSPFISPTPSFQPSFLNPSPLPHPPSTLQEILLTTKAIVNHVDSFGIFNPDYTQVGLRDVKGGEVGDVELVLGLRERGRVFFKAGTEVGGGEGGGSVTGRLRNVLGGAETLEGQASLGTKTKSAYQATFTTPVLASPLLSLALTGFSTDRDNSAFASHREQSQGVRSRFSAITPWGIHDLTWELIQRDIGHLSLNASVSIRQLAKSSTKSSISHTWTSDTRDDPWLGSSGRLLKLNHEYAGLPGSSEAVKFLKSTTQSQLSRRLYSTSNIHYSITSLTSILLPLSPHPTPLPDRIYLGGPNSVRGWRVGGIGKRDGVDSLGGEMAWGAGLSLMGPLWFNGWRKDWGVRWHGFLNGGKVVGWDKDRGFADNITKMYRNPNVSVGLGLMYRLDPIRIELNFSMPLIGRKGEAMARGLGVGVGLEFL